MVLRWHRTKVVDGTVGLSAYRTGPELCYLRLHQEADLHIYSRLLVSSLKITTSDCNPKYAATYRDPKYTAVPWVGGGKGSGGLNDEFFPSLAGNDQHLTEAPVAC